MADEIDITAERMIKEEEELARLRGPNPYKIPAGKEGECDLCGEHSTRLIKGVCARCRDKHNLP